MTFATLARRFERIAPTILTMAMLVLVVGFAAAGLSA